MGHQGGHSSAYSHALIEAYRGQRAPGNRWPRVCGTGWVALPRRRLHPLILYIYIKYYALFISIFHCICILLSPVTCGLPVIFCLDCDCI